MKELTIEQKAKAYDEAFRIAQELYNDPNSSNVGKGYVCTVFPEVKESDDENIRKWIIAQLELKSDVNNPHDLELMILKSIAWLEKQGKFDKIVEKAKIEKQRVLVTESDGSANIDWDTRSLKDARRLLECGLQYINTELEEQGEQKPKFRVGDTIKCKYDDRQFIIKSIDLDKGIYIYTQEGCGNNIDYADEMFELVEQKPANWSENIESAIKLLKDIAEEQEKDYCPYNANNLRKVAKYLETCSLRSSGSLQKSR